MEGRSKSAIVVGAFLIALGVFFLVTRFVPGIFGTFSWPVIRSFVNGVLGTMLQQGHVAGIEIVLADENHR